ncbi:hypothetical protein [Acinetobacter sp. YH12064]|uniref:hypothetical protein n=1 Tax=Acinetobacter sp. YH12064 TaxID=2601062 RepID=UPI0015D1BBB9|nr:hypothetical protein [Acinetobacter sp. YH12064]
MTIKPCKECGGPVSSKAESCPKCGAKQPKKTSVLTWVVLGVIVLVGVIGALAPEGSKKNQTEIAKLSSNNENSKEVTTPKNWSYETTKDEMRNTTTLFASNVSQNTVNFDFPYQGGSNLVITLRKKGDATDVIIAITKGQILCSIRNCEVAFKFDNNPIQSITMSEPDNHSADVLFVAHDSTAKKIINQMKTSKKLTIEAPFYQEGGKQFTFDVSNLDWK